LKGWNLFWHAIFFLFPKLKLFGFLEIKKKTKVPRFLWIDLYKKNLRLHHLFSLIFLAPCGGLKKQQQPLQLSLEIYAWDFFLSHGV
jgi:hypothetical protein